VKVEAQLGQHGVDKVLGLRESLTHAPLYFLDVTFLRYCCGVEILNVKGEDFGEEFGDLVPDLLVGMGAVVGYDAVGAVVQVDPLPVLDDGLVEDAEQRGRLESAQLVDFLHLLQQQLVEPTDAVRIDLVGGGAEEALPVADRLGSHVGQPNAQNLTQLDGDLTGEFVGIESCSVDDAVQNFGRRSLFGFLVALHQLLQAGHEQRAEIFG